MNNRVYKCRVRAGDDELTLNRKGFTGADPCVQPAQDRYQQQACAEKLHIERLFRLAFRLDVRRRVDCVRCGQGICRLQWARSGHSWLPNIPPLDSNGHRRLHAPPSCIDMVKIILTVDYS